MRAPWRRPMTVALTGIALTIPLAAVAVPASAAPLTPLAINEVSQNSPDPDWVEVVNDSTEPFDASGMIVRDNKDDSTFTIPSGTIVAAGGYYVAEVDPSFGLGKEDTVRLFASDGTTLVDSFTWSGHVPTSYGRCADDVFVVTAATSKGAANICEAPASGSIVINEIESKDEAGGPDWIELTNIAATTVNLSGLVLRDDKNDSTFTIPEGTTLAPGAFVAFDALGFGLGNPDAARLFDTDGVTLIDSFEWADHAGTTFGRCIDGIGGFVETETPTKAAANECAPIETPGIVVNEVESSGGTPGDWVEFYNPGTTAVDISGYQIKDNEDDHIFVVPAGTSIASGGYFVMEEAQFGNGFGSDDSVRLFLPYGFTVVDERSWTGHAATTYGLCATDFVTTTSPTKGAENDCSAPVRINEIESSGGTPGDWVELKNNGTDVVDLTGFEVRDSADDHVYAIPAGTTIEAGGYYIAEVEESYGLGGGDEARLFSPGGLVDSYAWVEHAPTTYGRCADGTGEFTATAAPTKGAANECEGDLETVPWPGSPDVSIVDDADTFGTNMSGLVFEGSALWAVQNGPGALYRLTDAGSTYELDAASGWGAAKPLRYEDGTGDVDAEGVTTADEPGILYVATERNNDGGGSRPSILRYDTSVAGDSLSATAEWNLAADLATDVPSIGANAGLEGIAWVPDSVLVAQGMLDEATNAPYDPATYPNHGIGLFFVGLEANGVVYGYALDEVTGAYTRVATIETGYPAGVMELEFDPATSSLWALCDNTCGGLSTILEVGADGRFAPSVLFERPAGLPDINNEGFAIAPVCVDGEKRVVWSDDDDTDGHALRAGALACTAGPVDPVDPGQLPDSGSATDPAALAVTGAELSGPLYAALLFMLAGAVVVVARRRSAVR